jgi:predicted transcriptional regulator YheO
VCSTSAEVRDDDDTVQQIADLFSVPRTTVYGHLNDASEGKRPTIHRNR